MDTPENIRRRMSALRESMVTTERESARQLATQQSCRMYVQADCPHKETQRGLEIGHLRMVEVERCSDCMKLMSNDGLIDTEIRFLPASIGFWPSTCIKKMDTAHSP